MKHILKQAGIASISMAMVFGGAVTVFAQEAVDISVSTESDVVTAGVVPGNPAFFLDRFAEFVQDAFTFDAKAKARLRVRFADERLAEIKLVLEDKDVSNRGVDRARQALARDVDRAESFITERSDELGDIKVELEQELAKNETEFLKELSQKQSELVKAQIELRKKIEALEKGNDTDNSLPGLQSEFESIQKDILGLGEDFDEFEIEIEDESEDDDSQETVHDRAQQAGQRMAQAYEERAKAVERLAKEKADGSLTAGAQSIFDAADDFLDQSERAFKSGSYVQAEYYAERAKKVFNDARSGKNFAPGQIEKESDDSSDDDDETEDSDDVDDDDDADDDSDDESDDTDDEENDDDSDDNDAEDDSDDEDEDDDSEDDDDSNSGSGNSGSDDNDD